MPDDEIIVVDQKPEQVYMGAEPIDWSEVPEDPGELQEYLSAKTRECLARVVVIAGRLAEEVGARNLKNESTNKLMTTIKTAASHLSDVSSLLAETTPRTINLTVQHGVPSRDGYCVYCGAEQEDKDTTGFDPPDDEE